VHGAYWLDGIALSGWSMAHDEAYLSIIPVFLHLGRWGRGREGDDEREGEERRAEDCLLEVR
jgi:hypothetical protein